MANVTYVLSKIEYILMRLNAVACEARLARYINEHVCPEHWRVRIDSYDRMPRGERRD
jgi:predicted kinase